nr:MAG TPA: hypothetical protein [Caudoviricetes sp.]
MNRCPIVILNKILYAVWLIDQTQLILASPPLRS